MSSSLLAVFCCLLTTILPAPANDDAKPDTDKRERPKVAKEGLRQELLKRTREDQDARKKLIELTSRRHAENDKTLSESAEFKSLRDIDRKNTAWLKMVVTAHGWPGKSAVGEDGAQAAWLLVQHADHDRDFQKQCLKLIQAAFKKGEVTGQQVAYLTDRVLVADKRNQLYGTQFQVKDGEMVPFPIEDEANVDKRRKEIGLSALAEYKKVLEKTYKVNKADKK
ncbi:MAG TPA: DUF6624 domain-containing protein [Gemmataceae bacterium]|nr:DUF6624 domain-containing protein [Gemmataceae bacterium]